MIRHQSFAEKTLIRSVLGFVIVATLVPFVNIVAVSFSSDIAVAQGKVFLLPVEPNVSPYGRILSYPLFFRGYLNTIVYTVIGTAISLTLNTMAAYALSQRMLFGRSVILKLFVFTLLFTGGLVPNFLLIRQLGWINKIWAIVVPEAINAWWLIIMMTFFQGIPEELPQAAEIDGANPFQIMLRIVLPISKAILATITLFYGVFYWNDWFRPFLFLTSQHRHPITLFLRDIVMGSELSSQQSMVAQSMQHNQPEVLRAAAIIVVSLPPIIVYPFIQKYFVKGILIGSVKG